MKKFYIGAELEIVEFDVEDVITTSEEEDEKVSEPSEIRSDAEQLPKEEEEVNLDLIDDDSDDDSILVDTEPVERPKYDPNAEPVYNEDGEQEL